MMPVCWDHFSFETCLTAFSTKPVKINHLILMPKDDVQFHPSSAKTASPVLPLDISRCPNTGCAGLFRAHLTELTHYCCHKRPPEQALTLKYCCPTERLPSGSWEIPVVFIFASFFNSD